MQVRASRPNSEPIEAPASAGYGLKKPEGTASFSVVLSATLDRWDALNSKLERRERALPAELESFIQLQRGMQSIGLGVQLATAVSETLNQTWKRLQQASGS